MRASGTGKPTPNFTWGDIEAMRAEAGLSLKPVPSGAFSVADYSKQFGLPRSTAQQQLKRLVSAGKLKSGKRAATDAAGRRFYEACYWK